VIAVPPPAADDSEDFDELEPDDSEDSEDVPRKAPWHFKILLVGSVIYLGYRTYQGIGWLVHHV
jgi:hypothetical protein